MAKKEITICDGCGKEIEYVSRAVYPSGLSVGYAPPQYHNLDLCENCYRVLLNLEENGIIRTSDQLPTEIKIGNGKLPEDGRIVAVWGNTHKGWALGSINHQTAEWTIQPYDTTSFKTRKGVQYWYPIPGELYPQ